ncbi:hypothetical protein BU25DRAFT_260087 [Macroventuria anomochaeta]|uniref:Uncharacterized protein n=1 Tax=Macroventuria anomochaeta TaxID=301207 RepID=A0ACB6S6V6_9PLEO|nr:uncharacterized protein BU25DRAFT_260087 [Macroventuria anomochaeta]KAF2629861.1 hypothetical protein BU25DRAFT_260087 [Macroventuria anomochaeta]
MVRRRFDIDVGTGNAHKSFPVFANLLTHRSRFFETAPSAGWKEVGECVVKLLDSHLAVFALYLHHVYKGDLPVIPDPKPAEDQTYLIHLGAAERLHLAKLYAFAECLQYIRTKNAGIKAFVAATFKMQAYGKWWAPRLGPVNTICQGTPPKSLMRRVLVECYTEFTKVHCTGEELQFYAELVQELAFSLLELGAEFITHRDNKHDKKKKHWKKHHPEEYLGEETGETA